MTHHLLDKKLSQDRDVNAKAMDMHGREVFAAIKKGKTAKKKMSLKIRPVNKSVDLAAATKAFLEDGGGKKKGRKKGGGRNLERDVDVWDEMEKLNEEEEETVTATAEA